MKTAYLLANPSLPIWRKHPLRGTSSRPVSQSGGAHTAYPAPRRAGSATRSGRRRARVRGRGGLSRPPPRPHARIHTPPPAQPPVNVTIIAVGLPKTGGCDVPRHPRGGHRFAGGRHRGEPRRSDHALASRRRKRAAGQHRQRRWPIRASTASTSGSSARLPVTYAPSGARSVSGAWSTARSGAARPPCRPCSTSRLCAKRTARMRPSASSNGSRCSTPGRSAAPSCRAGRPWTRRCRPRGRQPGLLRARQRQHPDAGRPPLLRKRWGGRPPAASTVPR
jgi:hypothetical protein